MKYKFTIEFKKEPNDYYIFICDKYKETKQYIKLTNISNLFTIYIFFEHVYKVIRG